MHLIHFKFASDERMKEKIAALGTSEKAAWEKLVERTEQICSVASELGVGIMIDAEETWIQDPI